MAKLTINGIEYTLVAVKHNEDYGYGHHNFEAVAEKDGKYYWAFSSGCSCNGGAHVDEVADTIKIFELEDGNVFKRGDAPIYQGEDLEFSDY